MASQQRTYQVMWAAARYLRYLTLSCLWLAFTARAQETPACDPVDGVKFICGVTNVEDFAPVVGTPWVIGSDDAAVGQKGTLYLFDTRTATATAFDSADLVFRLDKKRFTDCPGAPDLSVFSPLGLDITPASGNRRTLYVVNHGGRDGVEVFDVNLSRAKPYLTWVGCIVAPSGFWPDGVAALPKGRIVVTSMRDPTDDHWLEKLIKGQPIGGVAEWDPKRGWLEIPGSAGLSGPNGVVASSDGKWIYVAAWSGRELMRLSRGKTPAEKTIVRTGFLTDNLRWSPDRRSIYAGGQDTTVEEVSLICSKSKEVNCPNVPFRVDLVNPNTLEMTPLIKSGIYGSMGGGTGAIKVGDELWVSSYHADRIARFPANMVGDVLTRNPK